MRQSNAWRSDSGLSRGEIADSTVIWRWDFDRKVWHNGIDRHLLLWQVSIMAMTSLNISIPKSLSDYIESRVQDGHFSTASDYFYELVREEQRCHEEAKLETMLVGVKDG